MISTMFRGQVGKWAMTLFAAGAALTANEVLAQNAQYATGKAFFDAKCAVCHQAGGRGQDGLAPPLTELPGRYAASVEGRKQLGFTVLNGMFGEIALKGKTYNFRMTSFRNESDDDLASVLNYLVFDVDAKHAGAKPFTPAEVKTLRATQMAGDQVRERRDATLKSLGL